MTKEEIQERVDEVKSQLTIESVLQHYSVQPGKKPGEYHCPFHDDQTPSFKAKDGVVCCFAGCFQSKPMDVIGFIEKSDNVQFSEALKKAEAIAGIEPKSSKNTIPELKPLTLKHKSYLSSRGIQNVDEIQKRFQLKSHYNYITTELPIEGTRTVRFISTQKDSKYPAYYAKGSRRGPECYRDRVSSLPSKDIHLLVVAGEKDLWRVTDAMLETDTSNVVILSNTDGESNIPAHFFNEFVKLPVTKMDICYDHDEAGQKGAESVFRLAKQKFPAADVGILTFPKATKEKHDLTDFLNEGRSFNDIFQLNRTYARLRPQSRYFDSELFFTAKDLQGEAPPIPWLIKDFLPALLVGMITADGGTGKSWFTLQLATALASGLAFMHMPISQTGKVLYLGGEEQRDDIHRRYERIREDLMSEDIKVFMEAELSLERNLSFLCVNGVDSAFNNDSGLYPDLVAYIKEEKPMAVFLDPMARFYGKDENDSGEATRFVEQLEALTHHGTTVLFCHHTSQAGSKEISQHAFRGSSAFYDGARWQFNLQRIDEKSAESYEDEAGNTLNPKNAKNCVEGRITKCNGASIKHDQFLLMRKHTGVLFDSQMSFKRN